MGKEGVRICDAPGSKYAGKDDTTIDANSKTLTEIFVSAVREGYEAVTAKVHPETKKGAPNIARANLQHIDTSSSHASRSWTRKEVRIRHDGN